MSTLPTWDEQLADAVKVACVDLEQAGIKLPFWAMERALVATGWRPPVSADLLGDKDVVNADVGPALALTDERGLEMSGARRELVERAARRGYRGEAERYFRERRT